MKNMKNMKNLYIILSIFIIGYSLQSCTNDEVLEAVPNSGWIEIDGDTFENTINFDSDTYQIPVFLNSATNVNGITVTYDISLENGTLDDQTILGSRTIKIEADMKNGLIEFDPIFNASSYYTLKFKLTSVDDANFLVGLSDDSQPIEYLLTVTNFKPYDANVSAFGAAAPDYITTVGRMDATHFSVNSCWGPSFVAWATGNSAYDGQFLNAGVLTLDPADNSLSVTGDFIADTGSSGTFDSATGILSFSFAEANLFGSGFMVDTTLTPQP